MSNTPNEDGTNTDSDDSFTTPIKKTRWKKANPELRKKTERILRLTSPDYLANDINPSYSVNRQTFNNLIDGWSFSNEPDGVTMAENLLARMEELHETKAVVGIHGDVITPDVRSYTKVIGAYARGKVNGVTGATGYGHKAESLLHKMTELHASGVNTAAKPNLYTYTGAIESWASSFEEGSAHRAEELWKDLERKYEEEQTVDLKPNVRAYNAVINAWAKSGEAGSAQRAEYCLLKMQESYRNGNVDAKPHRINFNAVIHAWANSREPDGPERSEAILARMEELYRTERDEDVKPNVQSYNSVVDAYAKSGKADAAQTVLEHMNELHTAGNGDVKPNARSFNSVLNAYARSKEDGSPQKAQELLQEMERLYQAGNVDVQPDVHSFCTVINAYAKSPLLGKAETANEIFHHMLSQYNAGNKHLKPNVIIINSVMNACAYSIGDEMHRSRAMKIASEMFKELERSSYGSPDQVTYGTFLKVCAHQVPVGDARDAITEVVFKKACKDGQVGDMVMRQLRSMTTDRLYMKLVKKKKVESKKIYVDLPEHWYVNVRERRRLHPQTPKKAVDGVDVVESVKPPKRNYSFYKGNPDAKRS